MRTATKDQFKSLALFTSIVCIGIAIRFYHLTYYDPWFDEAISASRILNLKHFLQNVLSLYQLPLYYIFMRGFTDIFGLSILTLRLPSCLFNIASIFLIFAVCRNLYSRRAAFIAMCFFALSPFHIWYAQEARVYSLSTFLTLSIVYCFLQMQRKSKYHALYLTLFIIAACLNVFAHFLSIFIVFPFCVLLLKKRLVSIKTILYALPVILLVSLPLIIVIVRQILNIVNSFWLPAPKIFDVFIAITNFVVGYSLPLHMFIIALGVITILLAAWLIFAPKNQSYFIIVMTTLFPILFLAIASQFVSAFLPRQMIIFSPFLIIAISSTISFIRPSVMRIAIVSFFIMIFFLGISNNLIMHIQTPIRYHRGVLPKKQMQPVAQILKKHSTPHDIIIHTSQVTVTPLMFFTMQKNHGVMIFTMHHTDASEKTGLTPSTKSAKHTFRYGIESISSKEELQSILAASDFENVWLISSSWWRNGKLEHHEKMARNTFMELYERTYQDYYDGVYIDRFEIRHEGKHSSV